MEADIARQVGWPGRVALAAADPLPPESDGGLIRLLLAAMDEIDYGMVLADEEGRIRTVNEAARAHFRPGGTMLNDAGLLQWRDTDTARLWKKALWQARQGTRSLIPIGGPGHQRMVAVVPLASRSVLLLMGRQQVCEPLSAAFFARCHNLTIAEAAVLQALGNGASAAEIAADSGVAISTVRTQIGSLRAKVGAGNVRQLLGQLATLPPIRSALKLAGDLNQRCLRAIS